MEARIDAFEIYIHRQLLNITWTQKITNVEVHRRTGRDKRVLLITLKQRKLGYLGHVMRSRRYEPLKLILEGKLSSRRWQNSWMSDMPRWLGKSSAAIFRMAVSRLKMIVWYLLIIKKRRIRYRHIENW